MKMMKIFGILTIPLLLWYHYAETGFERILIGFIFVTAIIPALMNWLVIWCKELKFVKNSENQAKSSKNNEKTMKYYKNNTNFNQNYTKSNNKTSNKPKNPSEYYLVLQQLVVNYSKSGRLTRDTILTFLSEIDYRLKTHKFVYDKMDFDNEMNQIYVKIKSRQLKDIDYKYLINVLNELAGVTEDEIEPMDNDNEEFDYNNIPW